ncbi:MAG: hypothetical protein HYW07_17490 [Candidatus Latescibacteria bacterium]|nr:hypothetical protein [Candidatus Latescibacterota bacterium]
MSRKSSSLLLLTAFALSIGAAGAWAYENCNGVGYFALQWPANASVNVDGREGDWSWFDPEFIVGPDQMCNTLGNPIPPKSDIDIAIRAAWTPEPDNRLYVFVKVVDDTLDVDVADMNGGWQDDDMEVIMDADHDGSWHQAADALRTGHQQWTFHVPTPGGYPQVAFLRFNQPPEMQWAIDQGLVQGAVDVKPEAAHLATDVTVGYEVRMPTWDTYSPDGEAASVRHVFTAGQTIGMSITLNEGDGTGRTDQISTHAQEGGAHDSDFTSEFTMLATGEFATAVEAGSWGAIKALLR